MYCNKCGAKNEMASNYCVNCGERLNNYDMNDNDLKNTNGVLFASYFSIIALFLLIASVFFALANNLFEWFFSDNFWSFILFSVSIKLIDVSKKKYNDLLSRILSIIIGIIVIPFVIYILYVIISFIFFFEK